MPSIYEHPAIDTLLKELEPLPISFEHAEAHPDPRQRTRISTWPGEQDNAVVVGVPDDADPLEVAHALAALLLLYEQFPDPLAFPDPLRLALSITLNSYAAEMITDIGYDCGILLHPELLSLISGYYRHELLPLQTLRAWAILNALSGREYDIARENLLRYCPEVANGALSLQLPSLRPEAGHAQELLPALQNHLGIKDGARSL